MVLFTILALTLIIMVVIGLLLLSAGGALFLTVFGDIVICAVFIVLIMRWLIVRKKNKK